MYSGTVFIFFGSERVNRLTMCTVRVVIFKIGCSPLWLAGSHLEDLDQGERRLYPISVCLWFIFTLLPSNRTKNSSLPFCSTGHQWQIKLMNSRILDLKEPVKISRARVLYLGSITRSIKPLRWYEKLYMYVHMSFFSCGESIVIIGARRVLNSSLND